MSKTKQIIDLGYRTFETIAERDAYEGLVFEDLRAVVYADPTPSNNGVYRIDSILPTVWVVDDSSGSANLLDDIFDITWDGDIINGATRNALYDKFNSIDDLIDLLAPEKAQELTGLTLTITGATTYSAKIPSGLSASEWYTPSGVSVGDNISNVIYNPIFTLTANDFRSGSLGKPDTYGILSSIQNSSVTDTYDMTIDTPGTGNNGFVQITSVGEDQNGFWARADGRINVDLSGDEGYETYELSHTEAGTTNSFNIFYDNAGVTPSFNTNVAVFENTPVIKTLSGIDYYTVGSSFDVSYTIDNLFNKTYMQSGATQISSNAGSILNVDPNTIPAFSDSFSVSGEVYTLSTNDIFVEIPTLTVTARKPFDLNSASDNFDMTTINGLSYDGFGITSNNTFEGFNDESRRLIANTNTSFVSTNSLANGEAQIGQGVLSYGDIDYPAKTGAQQYDRKFVVGVQSGGTMTFTGFNPTNIGAADNSSSSIQIILELETEGLFFDLGRPFGSNNGTGDGTSIANSRGARVSVNSTTLNYTFGISTTANNNNEYRIIILLNNGIYTIGDITVS